MFQSNYAQTNKKARLSIKCSQEERKKIKMAALLAGKTINQWVLDSVLEKLVTTPQLKELSMKDAMAIVDELIVDVKPNLDRLAKK